MKSSHILIIVLLVISLIAFAFHGSCTFTPYSLSKSSLNMSRFEGFSSKYDSAGLGYSGYDLSGKVPAQNPADIEQAYVKLNGFSNGLYGSPDAGDRKDFFYGTQGSLDGGFYGYSNSMGSLQFTPDQLALLRSRGGNATGVDSMIGK